jgi:hypothetical protein
MRVIMPNPTRIHDGSHIPEKSMLFEKIIPALLILMGVLMVALILFAAGVLLGIIHF